MASIVQVFLYVLHIVANDLAFYVSLRSPEKVFLPITAMIEVVDFVREADRPTRRTIGQMRWPQDGDIDWGKACMGIYQRETVRGLDLKMAWIWRCGVTYVLAAGERGE